MLSLNWHWKRSPSLLLLNNHNGGMTAHFIIHLYYRAKEPVCSFEHTRKPLQRRLRDYATASSSHSQTCCYCPHSFVCLGLDCVLTFMFYRIFVFVYSIHLASRSKLNARALFIEVIMSVTNDIADVTNLCPPHEQQQLRRHWYMLREKSLLLIR